jgi:hypothetical protein
MEVSITYSCPRFYLYHLSQPMYADRPYCTQQPPTFNCDEVDPQIIFKIWSEGDPLVLRGCHMQGHWGPSYWISRFGTEGVTLEHCETGETKKSTVAEFLQTYGTEVSLADVWKLKVRRRTAPSIAIDQA